MALWLEKMESASTSNPFAAIFTVGLPEELSKLVPVLAIAVLAIRGVKWARNLRPRDYLFLGVISGLVFGAVEAETYLARGACRPTSRRHYPGSLVHTTMASSPTRSTRQSAPQSSTISVITGAHLLAPDR